VSVIALDATYSTGENLTGVGIYSREMLFGLSRLQADYRFLHCFRQHRLLKSMATALPPNCGRAVFGETWLFPPARVSLFHGLNQRMPARTFRRRVSTFHDLFVMTGEYSSSEFRTRFTRQAREAAERSDLIITVSEFTAAQVHELLGVEKSRLRVVHHGIRSLPAPPNTTRQRFILNVGAIQHRKNIIRLIRAFEGVPSDWRLVLAGAPDGFGGAEALDAASRSSANGRIEITGYVSTRRLATLYASASVFAFPSLDEGFGMPVLEAMAHGVPVLSSDRSALPEVCGDAAVLVDPGDQDSLTGALVRLTRDEKLRADLSTRGRARAATFTWRRAVEQTWQVYRELGAV
jgi:glycosyltransferase involved in cell wall biosynthesis